MNTIIKTISMKKLLLLLLLFTGMVNAQIVTIPDANFMAKLLAADVTNTIASTTNSATYPDTYNKIDANNDGEIQQSEAASVTLLNVSNSNISDLTGIEEFTNLHVLKCNGNQLTSLNINQSNILAFLECQDNNITSLNINNKTYLQLIFCYNNQLTSFTLNNLPSLANLYCGNNQLTALDVSGLTNLFFFGCENNQLSTLNVSNLAHLNSLDCQNNFIWNLNLTNTNNLQSLDCHNNQLTSLTMSTTLLNTVNTSEYLDCSNNQLTSLSYNGTSHFSIFNCSNNQINNLSITGVVSIVQLSCQNNQIYLLDLSNVELLSTGDFTNNSIGVINIKNGFIENFANFNITPSTAFPGLQYICADDNELSQLNNYLFSANLYNPSITINSYCSFTPGGNYNLVSGNIKFDANNNGCDASDLPQANIRVNINDGSNTGANFSNNTGNYSFYTQAGSFAVTPDIENPTWFTFSPISATIPFADNNNNLATQDFCIAANGVHNDLEVVVSPITPARPGFDATYKVVYKNKGNQTLSGNISFTYDDAVLDFVSATVPPSTQNTGIINWGYSNLLPFESRSIYITLNVNSPVETPAVNIGDVLNLNATITPVATDEIPADNSFSYNQTVVGAFDPNNITCLEGASVSPSTIGDYLHYAINFENTGNYQAENIVVKTTIDPTKFDINSLQLLNTSYPVEARITGNVVEFIFKTIHLATGGHGHILLKMRSNGALVEGDNVSKRADIFFDYNAPIDTGLVNTVFESLSNSIVILDNSVSVYPNPAKDAVNINCNSTIKTIELFDIQGRILTTKIVDDSISNFDISTYSNGVYFLKITTEKGSKVEKIIKE